MPEGRKKRIILVAHAKDLVGQRLQVPFEDFGAVEREVQRVRAAVRLVVAGYGLPECGCLSQIEPPHEPGKPQHGDFSGG